MSDQSPFTGIPTVEALGAIGVTSDIVRAYCSHNAISRTDLPALITEVHKAVTNLYTPSAPAQVEEKLTPAVSIKKSITPDLIICLEDGKGFKSLKRHLRTHYKLTPEQYRERWNLPADYPMVAPNYSATRSRLARESGLGTK